MFRCARCYHFIPHQIKIRVPKMSPKKEVKQEYYYFENYQQLFYQFAQEHVNVELFFLLF